MDLGFLMGLQLVNVALAMLGAAGLVMFVVVLFKLNTALNIWLAKNR